MEKPAVGKCSMGNWLLPKKAIVLNLFGNRQRQMMKSTGRAYKMSTPCQAGQTCVHSNKFNTLQPRPIGQKVKQTGFRSSVNTHNTGERAKGCTRVVYKWTQCDYLRKNTKNKLLTKIYTLSNIIEI